MALQGGPLLSGSAVSTTHAPVGQPGVVVVAGGEEPRIHDRLPSRAAAQVGSQCSFHGCGVVCHEAIVGVAGLQRGGLRALVGADQSHHYPRGAKAALAGATGGKRCQPAVTDRVVEAVEGGDRPTGDTARRGHTRHPGGTVNQNRAAPALALGAAAVLDRGDPDLTSQHVEQGCAGIVDVDFDLLTVNGELDDHRCCPMSSAQWWWAMTAPMIRRTTTRSRRSSRRWGW